MPWIHYSCNVNICHTEIGEDHSKEEVFVYYCVTFILTIFFTSIHLFTVFKMNIRVHREFLLLFFFFFLIGRGDVQMVSKSCWCVFLCISRASPYRKAERLLVFLMQLLAGFCRALA